MPSNAEIQFTFKIEDLTVAQIREVADILDGLTDSEACDYPATVTPIVEYGGPDGIDRVIGWGPTCDHILEARDAVVDQ